MAEESRRPQTVSWEEGRLKIIDQTRLPNEFVEISCDTIEEVWEAIKQLKVRGAPAIGITAALGVLVGLRNYVDGEQDEFTRRFDETADYLASSRPTAVNLFWALDRMRDTIESCEGRSNAETYEALEAEALRILEEDRLVCRRIGQHGNSLVGENAGILTHCNAGGLATADYGTALAVMFAAQDANKKIHVYADETRPLLQGARLTTWELMQAGIDVTLICDSMAGEVMKEGKVDLVIVGADRIARNGDTANKIGTYSVAVLAQHHGIPFYVAAPTSTFDLSTPSGEQIPIEQRSAEEITEGFGKRTAPEGVDVYSPAFDVTPAALVTGFITEVGVLSPPYEESIGSWVE